MSRKRTYDHVEIHINGVPLMIDNVESSLPNGNYGDTFEEEKQLSSSCSGVEHNPPVVS